MSLEVPSLTINLHISLWMHTFSFCKFINLKNFYIKEFINLHIYSASFIETFITSPIA